MFIADLQNGLTARFQLNGRANSQLLEELGFPTLKMKAVIAIVILLTMPVKANGNKAKCSMNGMCAWKGDCKVFSSLL